MRKLTKIFVISVVLLLPVLVFLFLKQFGSNEFTLPYYYEDGHPLPECNSSSGPHFVSKEFVAQGGMELPMLFGYVGSERNEFSADLDNVLKKYPDVAFSMNDLFEPLEESQRQIINCELTMGEDRYLNETPAYKYVLIDKQRRIRGYFQLDNLDEIVRLDMELDILLNY